MAWHLKTHQRSVNTGDGDYGAVKSRSNGIAFRERIKDLLVEPPRNHNCLTSIFRDQFLQSVTCLLFSIWDAELVISRCTVTLWSAKESEDLQPRFLPAEMLWPQVKSKNWAIWKYVYGGKPWFDVWNTPCKTTCYMSITNSEDIWDFFFFLKRRLP